MKLQHACRREEYGSKRRGTLPQPAASAKWLAVAAAALASGEACHYHPPAGEKEFDW
jgi:hypothetical protein